MKHLLLILFLLFFTACESYNNVNKTPSVIGNISDTSSWYSDMSNEVLEMNLSIQTPNSLECSPWNNLNAAPRPCTLDDVNHDTDPYDTYKPTIAIQMNTLDFIPTNEQPNATLRQKGKSTREAEQKSYRVKLNRDSLYKNERTLQMNKHPYDYSRIKNRLAFDFFREVPNITSLKTRFINLYIDTNNTGFYTEIEHVDEYFLKNRSWNVDDNLYKAQNFDFRYSSDLSLNENGKPNNPEKFDAIIEVENGKKQTKLIEMLQAINKQMTDKEFNTVFNKYFNRENYITWMALNVILGNKDTINQNFYLYNPLHSDTFYFLPWDYDGSLQSPSKFSKWQKGIALWWDIPLHKKFLTIKKNRDDLDAKISQLRQDYITDQRVKIMLDTYQPIVKHYISIEPDNKYLSYSRWQESYTSLYSVIEELITSYKNELGAPMPFWQEANYQNSTLTLGWNKSIELENDPITYSLQVADNYDMNNSIINITDTKNLIINEDQDNLYYSKSINLTPGTYYMKVIAREENNASSYQIAFDEVFLPDDRIVYGVLEFEVQ